MKTFEEMTWKELCDLEAKHPLQIGFSGYSKKYLGKLAKRKARVDRAKAASVSATKMESAKAPKNAKLPSRKKAG